MSKTISVEITADGIFNIEWGGDLDGVCCGPDEKLLTEKLSQLGIQLDAQKVFCRLPKEDSVKAQSQGICIQGLRGGISNG